MTRFTIPIFDSNFHPALISEKSKNALPELKKDCEVNNVRWLMLNQPEKEFNQSDLLKLTDVNIYPIYTIGGIDNQSSTEILNQVAFAKNNGFKGIKIHPNSGQFTLTHPIITDIILSASQANLPVFICTYFYNSFNGSYKNNISSLIQLLENTSEANVMLLHSGGVHLLEFIEIARAFKNVTLDLSFTLNKYRGSSIDNDIAFAFNTFDQRIVIGSDHPDFSLSQLRSAFEYFSQNIDTKKLENIAWKNMHRFLNIPY